MASQAAVSAARVSEATNPLDIPGETAKRRGAPYAPPPYLARLGGPRSVTDLGNADFFAFDRTDRMRDADRARGSSRADCLTNAWPSSGSVSRS